MRTLIISTLILTGLALQTAMAAQVTGTASVRILEPVQVSMTLANATSLNIANSNSINDVTFSASRDTHFVVSYNGQDTCSHIAANAQTISSACATATLNFN